MAEDEASPIPEGFPEDTVLIPIQETTVFSPSTELQPGSKYGLAALPSHFEVESTIDEESGTAYIIYAFHTSFGVFRFTFPAKFAGDHMRKISEHLGRLAATQSLVIAKDMPPYPGDAVPR